MEEETHVKPIPRGRIHERVPVRIVCAVLFWFGILYPLLSISTTIYSTVISPPNPQSYANMIPVWVNSFLWPMTTGLMMVGMAKIIELADTLLKRIGGNPERETRTPPQPMQE
jgi:hypothetical protein